MKRALKWVLAVIGTGAALIAALWVMTRGDYTVPALVTEAPDIPQATIAGVELHLETIQGPQDAPVIIVLHGGPGGDFASLAALSFLADDYTVVFYDQRGAGLSARVPPEMLTLDGYLTELAAVIAHASPDKPVILIGHSWGAMLALAHLGQAPGTVTSAILIEPGYIDAAGRSAWQARRDSYLSGPAYLAQAVTNGFRAAHVDGPDAQAADDFLIGQMAHVFANHPDNPYHCGQGYSAPLLRFGALASATWDSVPGAEVDRIAQGTTAPTPVLLVAGACDDWLGAPLQERHLPRFRNARIAVIPDAGHDTVWDNPDGTLAEIRAFLATP